MPDGSEVYTFDEIQDALRRMHGEEVTLVCRGGELQQVYYYYEVKGNAIDGAYQASPPRKCCIWSVDGC